MHYDFEQLTARTSHRCQPATRREFKLDLAASTRILQSTVAPVAGSRIQSFCYGDSLVGPVLCSISSPTVLRNRVLLEPPRPLPQHTAQVQDCGSGIGLSRCADGSRTFSRIGLRGDGRASRTNRRSQRAYPYVFEVDSDIWSSIVFSSEAPSAWLDSDVRPGKIIGSRIQKRYPLVQLCMGLESRAAY